MYIPCYRTTLSYTWYIHVHTFREMYIIHLHTVLKIYKHVCTWYIHVYTFQSINMYIHGSDVYVHVYTSINLYTHVLISINMYTMYIHVCTAYVLCTEGYIHLMKCTDIVEHNTYTVQTLLNLVRTLLYLFDSAFLFALLAGLLAGPGCCQVSRLFKFKHTS